jgi:hypothetical protein
MQSRACVCLCVCVCVGIDITSKGELQPLSQGGVTVVSVKFAKLKINSTLFPPLV